MSKSKSKFSITDKFRITDDHQIIERLVEKERLEKERLEKERLEIQKCKEKIRSISKKLEELIIEKHNKNLEEEIKIKIKIQEKDLKDLKPGSNLNKRREENKKELEKIREMSREDLKRKIEWNNLGLKLIEMDYKTGGSTRQKKRILKAPTKGKALKAKKPVRPANKIAK
jgi:hypothetical protein